MVIADAVATNPTGNRAMPLCIPTGEIGMEGFFPDGERGGPGLLFSFFANAGRGKRSRVDRARDGVKTTQTIHSRHCTRLSNQVLETSPVITHEDPMKERRGTPPSGGVGLS